MRLDDRCRCASISGKATCYLDSILISIIIMLFLQLSSLFFAYFMFINSRFIFHKINYFTNFDPEKVYLLVVWLYCLANSTSIFNLLSRKRQKSNLFQKRDIKNTLPRIIFSCINVFAEYIMKPTNVFMAGLVKVVHIYGRSSKGCSYLWQAQ